jgi:hypothetical protein
MVFVSSVAQDTWASWESGVAYQALAASVILLVVENPAIVVSNTLLGCTTPRPAWFPLEPAVVAYLKWVVSTTDETVYHPSN